MSGTLLSPNARGTQELTFDATDPGGPGVYAVTAQIDGKTLYSGTPDTNGGACVPVGTSSGALMFDYNQPCKTSESVDLPINTTTVADGKHTLKVTVEDAAQNSSVVYDSTITTDNAPVDTSAPTVIAPSQVFAGAALSTHPGAWSAPSGAGSIAYGYQWEDCDTQGNNCTAIAGAQNASYTPAPSDVGDTLRLVVNAADSDGLASATSAATGVVLSAQGSLGAPNGPGTGGASLTSTVVSAGSVTGLGAPNGTVASETAELRLGIHRAISRTFAQRSFQVTGRLIGSGAHPIGGANLDVLEQVAGSQTLRVIEHTKTRLDGTFAITCPSGTIKTRRGRLPGVLRGCRVRRRGEDRGVRQRGRPAQRHPAPNGLDGDDHAQRTGGRASPVAGRGRRAARALPRTLGALPRPAHELQRPVPGRLPVPGRHRALPVPRGGLRRTGRVPIHPRR